MKASPEFHSINSIGLLNGENQSALELQTVNGVQFKSWFSGIGLGLDYYRYRTIPLFLDLRKDFGKSRDKVFIYADAGINFGWPTETQKTPYVANDHFGNRFYSDVGFGYKLSTGKNKFLLLSLGYSFKRVRESYDQLYFTPLDYGSPPTPKETINSDLNRISTKISFEF